MAEHYVQTDFKNKKRSTNDQKIHYDDEYNYCALLDKYWNIANTQGKKPVFYLTENDISHDMNEAPAVVVYNKEATTNPVGINYPAVRKTKKIVIETIALSRGILFDTKDEILRIAKFCRKRPIRHWDATLEIVDIREDPRAGNYHYLVQVNLIRWVEPIAEALWDEPIALNVFANYMPTMGISPTAVSFNSTVVGGIAPFTYLWDFGDGKVGSILPNPVHTYTATVPSSYQPSVTVYDSNKHYAKWVGGYISINPPAFSVTPFVAPNNGNSPLSVHFFSNAFNGVLPYLYGWDFGDGNTSTEVNPYHRYTVTETTDFTTVLTATDTAGYVASGSIEVIVRNSDYEWLWGLIEGLYPFLANLFGLESLPFSEVKAYSISVGRTADAMHYTFLANNAGGDYNKITYSIFEFAYPIILRYSTYSLFPPTFEEFITNVGFASPITPETSYYFLVGIAYSIAGIQEVLDITTAINGYLIHEGYPINTDVPTAQFTHVIQNGNTTSISNGETYSAIPNVALTFGGTYLTSLYMEWSLSGTDGDWNNVANFGGDENGAGNYDEGIFSDIYHMEWGYGPTTIYIRAMNGNGLSTPEHIYINQPDVLSVTITSPTNGVEVSGSAVNVSATVSGGSNSQYQCALYLRNEFQRSGLTPTNLGTFDSTQYPDGSLSITVDATDSLSNTATDTIYVAVNNFVPGPTTLLDTNFDDGTLQGWGGGSSGNGVVSSTQSHSAPNSLHVYLDNTYTNSNSHYVLTDDGGQYDMTFWVFIDALPNGVIGQLINFTDKNQSQYYIYVFIMNVSGTLTVMYGNSVSDTGVTMNFNEWTKFGYKWTSGTTAFDLYVNDVSIGTFDNDFGGPAVGIGFIGFNFCNNMNTSAYIDDIILKKS